MFAPPPRPAPWRRHLVATLGASCALAVSGLGVARCNPRIDEALPRVEAPLPTLYVPITMSPPPPAPAPPGRGGGGGTPARNKRTEPADPEPEVPAAPLDTQRLLSRVDLQSLGRRTRDGGPGAGGPGASGAGAGLGNPGTGTGAGGAGIQDLQPLFTPSPSFPRAARELGLEALCAVTFHVNREGRTTRVAIKGCDEAFHAAIERAALRWRFEPKRVGGKRVPALMTKRIRFIIR